VLIAQDYSLADDEAHLRILLPYFHDPRYIRIHNKPLFLVYFASRFPDPRATTALWRQLGFWVQAGLLLVGGLLSLGTLVLPILGAVATLAGIALVVSRLRQPRMASA